MEERRMPIYEYECRKCGQVLEAYQNFSDPSLKKCKHCSGRLQKLISQSTFHLKGTGWYVTDYGKGAGGKGSGTAPSSTSGNSQTSEGGTTKTSESRSAKMSKKGAAKESGTKSKSSSST